uniref:Uncharacterized protein n=1 Tax=Rhodopseudomonas palustris (strain BisA53) TaxID=316055 RepID=Q07JF9_RHOP5
MMDQDPPRTVQSLFGKTIDTPDPGSTGAAEPTGSKAGNPASTVKVGAGDPSPILPETPLPTVQVNNGEALASQPDKPSDSIGKRAAESTILKLPGPDGVGRKLSYRRTDMASVSRHHRGWADINALIEDVALDAVDRDLRIIFLVARVNDLEPARRLAGALGDGRPMQRSDEGPGLEPFRFDEIIEAIDAALAETDAAGAVFIDTVSVTALDGTFPAAVLRWAGGSVDESEEDPSSRLRARNSRLLVLVVAETGCSVMPLLEAQPQPQSVLLPWTGSWLARNARSLGFVEAELDRSVGRELRNAACVYDSASGEREKVLHLLLLQIEGGNEEADGPTALGDHIKKKIQESKTGKRALADEAHARFLDVMRSDDDPIYGGPIGRTILLVALLVPDRPATAVLGLCRYLLPEGPARTTCLTAVLRQTWQSGVEDDRRLRQPARSPPGWNAVFDDVSDRVVDEIGLVLGQKGNLERGKKLTWLDAKKSLLAQNGRLMELARRVLTQAPATAMPITIMPVLIDLAMALYRLDGGYLSMHDLVSIFAGMRQGETDLAVVSFAESELLNTILKEHAPQVRLIGAQGALSGLQALAESQISEVLLAKQSFEKSSRSTLDELIYRLRGEAAGRLRNVLESWTEHGQVGDEELEDFLDDLFDRIPAESALVVQAYLVLYGPCPKTAILGRATLGLFADLGRVHFTDRFRSFRETSGDVLTAALRGGDRRVADVDQWADALWVAADNAPFRSYGKALAIWLDDLLSTWEIPAMAQDLHHPHRDAGLLPRLMIRSTDPRAGVEFDLLGRLFRRTPNEGLEALQTLAFLAGGPRDDTAPALRLLDMIRRRIDDIFWIMVEEIDRKEAETRGLRLDQLETIVWSTLSRHYKLALVLDSESASQAILGQIDAPEATRSDSRGLLDLYAPATLMFWRFSKFETRALVPGEDDYDALLATLDRVAKAISPPEHYQRTRVAWAALTDVQEQLVAYFRSQRCSRTLARHEERLACWRAVKGYLFPAVLSVVKSTGEVR